MKVNELIELLEKLDPRAEVCVLGVREWDRFNYRCAKLIEVKTTLDDGIYYEDDEDGITIVYALIPAYVT